jgi:hypothetical protein
MFQDFHLVQMHLQNSSYYSSKSTYIQLSPLNYKETLDSLSQFLFTNIKFSSFILFYFMFEIS